MKIGHTLYSLGNILSPSSHMVESKEIADPQRKNAWIQVRVQAHSATVGKHTHDQQRDKENMHAIM